MGSRQNLMSSFANVSKTIATLHKVHKNAQAVDVCLAHAGARFLWLVTIKKFSPQEIFAMGLLDPAIPGWELLLNYESKESVWPIYTKLNEHPDRAYIDDKAKFQVMCEEWRLPTLVCYVRLTATKVARLDDQVESGDYSEYRELMARLPGHFVTKPSISYGGHCTTFFRKQDGHVVTYAGHALDPAGFVRMLRETLDAPTLRDEYQPSDKLVLFQELGCAHPEIADLTENDFMQTLRVCTYLRRTGEPIILFAFLKLLKHGNIIDNFHKGITGNMLAYMDRERGEVYRVIARAADTGANRVICVHPSSGKTLQGFPVPFWDESCNIAMQCAKRFANTRAVGWDIGITPRGPVVLEGNCTWDPGHPVFDGNRLRKVVSVDKP